MTNEKLKQLHENVKTFCEALPDNTNLRLGQIYMNQLFDVDQDTYNLITASVFDPFYTDEVLPIFFKYLKSICVD
jgi:hypothetical protein